MTTLSIPVSRRRLAASLLLLGFAASPCISESHREPGSAPQPATIHVKFTDFVALLTKPPSCEVGVPCLQAAGELMKFPALDVYSSDGLALFHSSNLHTSSRFLARLPHSISRLHPNPRARTFDLVRTRLGLPLSPAIGGVAQPFIFVQYELQECSACSAQSEIIARQLRNTRIPYVLYTVVVDL